jgi:hypothetical protein
MGQGISDSVIVVVKLRAYEDMVTYLRVKLLENDENQGEGPNMLTCKTLTFETIVSEIVRKLLDLKDIVISRKKGNR